MNRCQICCKDNNTREVNIEIFGSNLIICFYCEKKLKEKILQMAIQKDKPSKKRPSSIILDTQDNKPKGLKFIVGDRVQRLTNFLDSKSEMMFGNVKEVNSEAYVVKWDDGSLGYYLPHGIDLV